jgi:hypothetical protein
MFASASSRVSPWLTQPGSARKGFDSLDTYLSSLS